MIKAAINALDRWIRTGERAPSAESIPRNAAGTDVERDELGNAVGGIRTPYVDVPVATLSGYGQTGTSFCGAFGTTTAPWIRPTSSFSPGRLANRAESRGTRVGETTRPGASM